MIRTILVCLLAAMLTLSSALSESCADNKDSLLKDVEFAEGFGAAFIYGSEYSGGRRPPLGEVKKYRDISPWQVFLIPDGPVKKVGVKPSGCTAPTVGRAARPRRPQLKCGTSMTRRPPGASRWWISQKIVDRSVKCSRTCDV